MAAQPRVIDYEAHFLPRGIFDKHAEEDPLTFLRLNDAIWALPNNESKRIYLKALATELVLLESDPFCYLQANDFNTKEAARHLLRYWKKRHTLFGEVDAFKPMTFCNGALNDDDREQVRTGYMGNSRSSGMPGIPSVTVIDAARLRDGVPYNTILRGSFYSLHACSTRPNASHPSFDEIALVIITRRGLRLVDFEKSHMFTSCFTQRLGAIHMLDMCDFENWTSLPFEGGVRRLFGRLLSYVRGDVFVHSGYSSLQEMCASICRLGMKPQAVPTSLGGTWEYNELEPYFQARIKYENHLYAGFPGFGEKEVDIPLKLNPIPVMNQQKGKVFEMYEMEANIEALPQEAQDRYQTAKGNTLPATWNYECRLLAFLLVEEGNGRLAAQRVIRYWELRETVFGAQLQYELLTQTGEEALDAADLHALDAGFVGPLPSTEDGQLVVTIDANNEITTTVRRHCLFYMFSVLSENQAAQTKGIAVLYHQSDTGADVVKGDVKFLEELDRSLAVKIHSFHRISLAGSAGDLDQANDPLSRLEPAELNHHHVFTNMAAAARILHEQHGFSLSGVPSYLGGTWGEARGREWLERRTHVELGLPVNSNFSPVPGERPLHPRDEQDELQRRVDVIQSRFHAGP